MNSLLGVKSEMSGYIAKKVLVAKKNSSSTDDHQPVYKITLKAHFQIPNIGGHKFKAASPIPSSKIDSDEMLTMTDLYTIIRELSRSDTRCGMFDVIHPAPLKMLGFLGGSKQFCTRSNEMDSLPIEFLNISCTATIDIGICNLNTGVDERIANNKKRKANQLSSASLSTSRQESTIDMRGEDNATDYGDDESCTFISPSSINKQTFSFKFDKAFIPLMFDLNNGRIENSNSGKSSN